MWIICIFLVIIILCNIRSYRMKHHAMSSGREPAEMPPENLPPEETEATLAARTWAMNRMEAMEKKGLGEYITQDYCFKNDITQKDLQSLKTIENKMNLMLTEMEQYLKLPKTYHVQVVDNSRSQASVTASGTCDFMHYTINIFYNAFPPDMLRTILCHECAHYFTHYYGLEINADYLNERYTDTVAILMGFGRYTLATKGNPGYLSYDQLREVRCTQLKKRKEMAERPQPAAAQQKPQQPAKKPVRKPIRETSRRPVQKPPANPVQKAFHRTVTEKNTAALGVEREELRKDILAARVLIAQAKDLVRINKVPTATDLYPGDYDFLKKAVDQLNAGSYETILRNAEGRISGNLRDIREAGGMTMAVCQELSRVMRAFA